MKRRHSDQTATIAPPPPAKSDARSAFTLIELSIVLVIIGLIIGGVLVGQDLVKAAETRAQITQIEKYNTAVNTFRNKYGGIPGDLALTQASQFGFAVPASCTGQVGGRDGNGLIDGYSGGKYNALMGENVLFWADLGAANLIDGSYINDQQHASCVASIDSTTLNVGYLPVGKIGYSTNIHVYETNGNNWFMLAQIATFNSGFSVVEATAVIPVNQAYNIDKKMDDGLPATGIVQAVYVNNSATVTSNAPNGNPDTASTCYNSSTLAYSTGVSNGSGPNCALSFKMQGAAR